MEYQGYKNVNEAYEAHRNDRNCDSHLWLYAKKHYIRGDIWEDLKLLVALRCLISPEDVTKGGILTVLGGIAIPFLRQSVHELEGFIGRLSPNHVQHYSLRRDGDSAAEPYEDRLLAAYLGFMSTQRVRRQDEVLIYLDPVDPNLLPVKPPTE